MISSQGRRQGVSRVPIAHYIDWPSVNICSVYDVSFSFFRFLQGLNFHAYLNSEYSLKHCRRRKARTVFSDHQLNGLEKRFDGQKYLSTPERVELANALNLSEAQVSDGHMPFTGNNLFSFHFSFSVILIYQGQNMVCSFHVLILCIKIIFS